jgi:hypothetical protein
MVIADKDPTTGILIGGATIVGVGNASPYYIGSTSDGMMIYVPQSDSTIAAYSTLCPP